MKKERTPSEDRPNVRRAWLLAAVAGLGAAACAHARPKVGPVTAVPPTSTSAPAAAAAEPSVRGDLMHSIPELVAVHFGYDSATLGRLARAALRKNVTWIMEHQELKVQVAGHCDTRGTEEYNLALGQRRAEAVRDYYLRSGVPGGRVATISYGKDRPLCQRETEACWAKCRRAETLVALPRPISDAR